MRLLIALLLASTAAFAQDRGSVPLGQSPDGAKPADGAIVGGSILPGEKSGMPVIKPTSEEREKRCMELQGVLREECLLNEKGASSGGTAPEPQSGTPPRTAPPPQNPPVIR